MDRIASTTLVAALLTVSGLGVASAVAADRWVGHYTGHIDSYHWTATITKRSVGSYDFHVTVGSQMPACMGEFSGPAKLAGGRLLIDGQDCSLTVSRLGANGIRIDEKQCSFSHGVACGFESELTRSRAGRASHKAAAGVSP